MLTTLNPNCGRDGAAPKTATTMFKRGKAAAAGLLPSSLRYKRRALKSSVAALQQHFQNDKEQVTGHTESANETIIGNNNNNNKETPVIPVRHENSNVINQESLQPKNKNSDSNGTDGVYIVDLDAPLVAHEALFTTKAQQPRQSDRNGHFTLPRTKHQHPPSRLEEMGKASINADTALLQSRVQLPRKRSRSARRGFFRSNNEQKAPPDTNAKMQVQPSEINGLTVPNLTWYDRHFRRRFEKNRAGTTAENNNEGLIKKDRPKSPHHLLSGRLQQQPQEKNAATNSVLKECKQKQQEIVPRQRFQPPISNNDRDHFSAWRIGKPVRLSQGEDKDEGEMSDEASAGEFRGMLVSDIDEESSGDDDADNFDDTRSDDPTLCLLHRRGEMRRKCRSNYPSSSFKGIAKYCENCDTDEAATEEEVMIVDLDDAINFPSSSRGTAAAAVSSDSEVLCHRRNGIRSGGVGLSHRHEILCSPSNSISRRHRSRRNFLLPMSPEADNDAETEYYDWSGQNSLTGRRLSITNDRSTIYTPTSSTTTTLSPVSPRNQLIFGQHQQTQRQRKTMHRMCNVRRLFPSLSTIYPNNSPPALMSLNGIDENWMDECSRFNPSRCEFLPPPPPLRTATDTEKRRSKLSAAGERLTTASMDEDENDGDLNAQTQAQLNQKTACAFQQEQTMEMNMPEQNGQKSPKRNEKNMDYEQQSTPLANKTNSSTTNSQRCSPMNVDNEGENKACAKLTAKTGNKQNEVTRNQQKSAAVLNNDVPISALNAKRFDDEKFLSDLPPIIQPLRLWRPIQTSTRTNLASAENGQRTGPRQMRCSFVGSTQQNSGALPLLPAGGVVSDGQRAAPKTNPRISQSKMAITALRSNDRLLSPTKMESNEKSSQRQQLLQTSIYSPTHRHLPALTASGIKAKSLFDPAYQDATTLANAALAIRPESFNLPSALAKSYGIKGILFLSISLIDWQLVVHVQNAAYFVPTPVSTCVKLELRRSVSERHRKRTRHHEHQQFYRYRAMRSAVVPYTNQPTYDETFTFNVSRVHLKNGDKLCLSVYGASSLSTNSVDTEFDFAPHKMLGRMSFSLRKFFRTAYPTAFPTFLYHDLLLLDDNDGEPITVCQGGYFLLPERTGSLSHLSQDNVLHRKYYDEIGVNNGPHTATPLAFPSVQSSSNVMHFQKPPTHKNAQQNRWNFMPATLGGSIPATTTTSDSSTQPSYSPFKQMLIKNTTQNQNHHQQKPNNDCWGMSIGSTPNIADQLAQRQQNLNTNGTAATKTMKEQQKQPTSKQTLTSKQLQNPLAANTLNQQQLSSLEVEGNVPRQIAKTAIAMANAGPLAAGFHQPLRSKYEFTEARHCPSNAKQQQPSMSTTNSLRRRSKVSGASMSPSPQTSLSPKNAAAAGLRRVSEDFRLQKQRRSMGNILTKTTNITDSMPVLRSNDNRNGTIAETTEIMSNVVDHTTMANGISAGDRHNVANGEIGSNFGEFQQMITVDSDGSATGAIIDGYIDDDYGELMDLQQDMRCERRRASCNDAAMYSFNHNTRLEYTTSTESTSSSSSAGIDPKRLRPTSVESSSTGCSLLNPNHSSLPFVFQPRQSVTTPGTTTTTTTTSTSAAFLTTTGEEDSFSSMIAADPFYASAHCRIDNESMSGEDDYMFRINGAVSNGGASAPTSPVSVPKTAASAESRKSFCSTNARQQAAAGSKLIDPTKLLHPNTAEKGSRKAQKNNVDKAVEQSQQPVRRVASFTFSLSQADDNDEKVHHHQQKRQSQGRAVAHVATVVQHAKASAKFTLGPIGKTVKKILRPKKDSLTGLPFGAIDLPTLEECNRWQHSFHELLNHKYGLMLFRYFVAIEHSDENLDFWKRCEEFKQLKSVGEWEKAAEKALEIFDQHIATTAENEVNLDSATKVSTQAALEAVGLFAHSVFSGEQKKSPQHVDTELAAVGEQLDAATFNIAQTKIEQLMEKDSYQRFIKSDAYLTLLQQLTEAAEKRQNRRHSSFFGRGNGVSGCLSPTEKTAPAGASFGGRLSPFSSNRIDPTKKRRSTGSASPVDKSAEERQFDSGAFVRSRSVIKSK